MNVVPYARKASGQSSVMLSAEESDKKSLAEKCKPFFGAARLYLFVLDSNIFLPPAPVVGQLKSFQ